jgi:HK97 family phage major capsid protein
MALIMPAGFESREDIKAGFAFVNERMDALAASGKQADPQEMENLKRAMADVMAAQKALDEKLAATRIVSPSDNDLTRSVAALTFPFKVDDDFSHISREQWNLLNYTPNELAFASSASRFHNGLGVRAAAAIDAIPSSAFDRLIVRLQQVNDALYTLDTILSGTEAYQHKGDTRLQRMKSLALWTEWEKLTRELADAGLNTGQSTAGSQWLPVYYSAQLQNLVQLELGVASLFATIDMPGKSYISPVVASDGLAYYVQEQSSGSVGTGATSLIPVNTATTQNMTLTAWKIASRMFCTSEATEDLIVPVIPFILGQLAKVLARAEDNIILNADGAAGTGTAHMDVNRTTAPAGPQTVADVAHHLRVPTSGIRKLQNVNGWSTGTATSGSSNTLIDFNVPTLATLLNARARLGSLGRRAADLPLIVNMTGLVKLYAIRDTLLMSVDKYGDGALIRTGEVGNIAGHPVIVSEFVPDNMDAVSGGGNGTRTEAGAYTCCFMPHVPSFVRGIRRGVTISRSSERHIEYDQLVFVATARRDFKPWYGTTPQAIIFGKM